MHALPIVLTGLICGTIASTLIPYFLRKPCPDFFGATCCVLLLSYILATPLLHLLELSEPEDGELEGSRCGEWRYMPGVYESGDENMGYAMEELVMEGEEADDEGDEDDEIEGNKAGQRENGMHDAVPLDEQESPI